MEFPKPIRGEDKRFKVYLHREPDVGQVFWKITGGTGGKAPNLEFYRVEQIEHRPSKVRGGTTTTITWVSSKGERFTSAVRDKSMRKVAAVRKSGKRQIVRESIEDQNA